MAYVIVLSFEDKVEADLCLEQIADDTILDVTDLKLMCPTGIGIGHRYKMSYVSDEEEKIVADAYADHQH